MGWTKGKERRKEEKESVHLLFFFEDYSASVLYHRFFSRPTNVTKAIYPRDDSPFQNIER